MDTLEEDTRDFYKESYEVEVFDELTLDEYVNWHMRTNVAYKHTHKLDKLG